MKRSTLLYIAGSMLLTSSCKTLPMVNSIEEDQIELVTSKYYDSKSQIRYRVSNDDENIHLNIKTNHEPTIAKILRAGMTVYFDPSGRKKKNIYVNYPIGSPQDLQQVKPMRIGGKKADLKTLINSTSTGVQWVQNEKKQSFTTLNPPANIQLSIKANESKELEYDLIIPFTQISTSGKAGLLNLTIGVVTGSFDFDQTDPLERGRTQEADLYGDSRMPQQGASSANASYGRGDRNSSPSPHSGFSEMNEESKIWFQVGLYR